MLSEVQPCPNCGYDLRGHADSTRCPECGKDVQVSAAIARTCRRLDLRLLDLWSIAILQAAGAITLAVTVFAMQGGYYVAIILGMMAGVCLSTATLWLVLILPGTVRLLRNPTARALVGRRTRQVTAWCLADAALVGLTVVLLGLAIA